MTTSMAAFMRSLKPNNFLISQPIIYIYNQQNAELTRLLNFLYDCQLRYVPFKDLSVVFEQMSLTEDATVNGHKGHTDRRPDEKRLG